MPVSLSKQVGSAVDRVFSNHPVLKDFAALKLQGGFDVRRFFRARERNEHEVVVWRDKWWDKNGGKIYVDLICVVSEYQLAMTGKTQSLLQPDWSVPLHYFREDHGSTNGHGLWAITSPECVVRFENEFSNWVIEVAQRWFAQFESVEAVVEYLSNRKSHVGSACLLASLGNTARAQSEVAAFLRGMPRQVDKALDRLVFAGLLTSIEKEGLQHASIQHEDDYRQYLQAWLKEHSERHSV